MRQKLSIVAVLVMAAVLFAFAGQLVMAQEEKAAEPEKSLYERLGGVYAIASVVDLFVEKLLVNDVLNANPLIDEARKRVPKAGLKFHVTALVCSLSGGPEVYSGRTMVAAHAHLNINEEQWNAMVADFVATLNEFNVPEKEQGELLALVGPTKGDIVTATEETEE
jgi:hemoglobin